MSCAFSSGPSFQRSQLVCSKRSLALLAADCLALFGTMFLIGVIRVLLGGEISLSQHVPLALFLLVVPVVNAFEGLYSGVPPALPEEAVSPAVPDSGTCWLPEVLYLHRYLRSHDDHRSLSARFLLQNIHFARYFPTITVTQASHCQFA